MPISSYHLVQHARETCECVVGESCQYGWNKSIAPMIETVSPRPWHARDCSKCDVSMQVRPGSPTPWGGWKQKAGEWKSCIFFRKSGKKYFLRGGVNIFGNSQKSCIWYVLYVVGLQIKSIIDQWSNWTLTVAIPGSQASKLSRPVKCDVGEWEWLKQVYRLMVATINRRAKPFQSPLSTANLWNCLPAPLPSATSLTVFRQRLKTFLFRRSYPDFLT